MSFRRLWVFLAVALPVLGALIAPMSMVDLAYQLRAGDEILATGRIPAVDAWTSTVAGTPWFNQQWGAQVVLSSVYGLAGWAGLAVFRALLVALAFGAVAAASAERGASVRTASILGLVAFLLASPALALRPQLFGIALFAGTLWLLAGRRRNPTRMWAVPVLAILWANAHGSFVLAPALAGWAWLEDAVERDPGARRTFVILLATAAATIVTPFGPSVWAYAIGLSTNAELAARITEWQPPSSADPVGAAFLASVAAVAIGIGVAWRRGRRLAWPSVALLAGLALLGLRAVRGIAWWPLGAAVLVAPLFAPRFGVHIERRTPPTAARLNAVMVVVLGAACMLLAASWVPADPRRDPPGRFADAPPGVTSILVSEAPPGAHLLHPQRWGSWLAFAVPEALVFVDSRIELFPAEGWDDYDAVAAGAAGWEDVLARREIAFVAVAPEDDALADRLREAGWDERYAGPDGWVFGAAGPGS
jgi:hypothetical protein